MSIKQTLEQIRQKFTIADFGVKEMEIRQGAVLPLLAEMGWNVFDTTGSVKPEYTVEMDGQNKRSVDFALYGEYIKTPFALIETKKRGDVLKAEDQLFEYLYREGAPLAIITDGRKWQLYWTTGPVKYKERLFYSCDICDDSLDEIAAILPTFLGFKQVRSGKAEEAIRSEYAKKSSDSRIAEVLGELWPATIKLHLPQLINSFNELTRSELNAVASETLLKEHFSNLYKLDLSSADLDVGSTREKIKVKQKDGSAANSKTPTQQPPASGFTLMGHHFPANSAIDALKQVYELLEARDSKWPDQMLAIQKSKSRPAISKTNGVYSGRSDGRQRTRELSFGWWMDTNLSVKQVKSLIHRACMVANLEFGRDLIVHF